MSEPGGYLKCFLYGLELGDDIAILMPVIHGSDSRRWRCLFAYLIRDTWCITIPYTGNTTSRRDNQMSRIPCLARDFSGFPWFWSCEHASM